MSGIAGQNIVAVVACAENIGIAGQGNIFNIGCRCVGNAADYCIGTCTFSFDNDIFDIINIISIVSPSSAHRIGTGFAVNSVITITTI